MKTKKPSVKNKVKKYEWVEREPAIVMGRKLSRGSILGYENDVFISYQPNEVAKISREDSDLDSANPETAIVIKNDRKTFDGTMRNRYLIYRGD
ncbi:MAG: hypothetical protein KGN01_08015, partial [Patescibacteria group bacterium]|nr:hypothetical protein [Patescibacteria group bacterium]